jgi:hypothetical protein
MNAPFLPPQRLGGDILSRVFPTAGQPLRAATWGDFKDSIEFYAEAITTGEILCDDPSLAGVDLLVIDALPAIRAGSPAHPSRGR